MRLNGKEIPHFYDGTLCALTDRNLRNAVFGFSCMGSGLPAETQPTASSKLFASASRSIPRFRDPHTKVGNPFRTTGPDAQLRHTLSSLLAWQVVISWSARRESVAFAAVSFWVFFPSVGYSSLQNPTPARCPFRGSQGFQPRSCLL